MTFQFKSRLLSLLIILILAFTGCQTSKPISPTSDAEISWGSEDLRFTGSQSLSQQVELAAVYSQTTADSILIRLDTLQDLPATWTLNLQLSAETNLDPPLLSFSLVNGNLEALKTTDEYRAAKVEPITIERDWLSIQLSGIPQDARFLKVLDADSGQQINSSPWIDLSQSMEPVKVQIQFFDILRGSTPAELHRQWDGAHSGPNGTRHGMKYILQSSKEYRLPIIMLDLLNHQTLNNIEYLGIKEIFTEQANNGLLDAPVYGIGFGEALSDSIARNSHLSIAGDSTPSFLYAPIVDTQYKFKNFFYQAASNAGNIYGDAKIKLVPSINPSTESQLDSQGITTATKKALLEQTTKSDKNNQVYIIGGSTINSMWGEPSPTSEAFHYLASHPWIEVIGLDGISSLKPKPLTEYVPRCSNSLCHVNLLELPENHPYQEWFNQRISSNEKIENESLHYLSANYFERILRITDPQELNLSWRGRYTPTGYLLADQWLQEPSQAATCDQDEHFCILSNDTYLALLLKDSASLAMFFTRDGESIQQWIAPFSQELTSYSDPTQWIEKAYIPLDPRLLPGASTIPVWNQADFNLSVNQDSINFTDLKSQIQINFLLDSSGLTIHSSNLADHSWQIPLLGILQTDPKTSPMLLSHVSGHQLTIKLDQLIQNYASSNSMQAVITAPEDPSASQPSGYYLPIPFDLLTTGTANEFEINLALTK